MCSEWTFIILPQFLHSVNFKGVLTQIRLIYLHSLGIQQMNFKFHLLPQPLSVPQAAHFLSVPSAFSRTSRNIHSDEMTKPSLTLILYPWMQTTQNISIIIPSPNRMWLGSYPTTKKEHNQISNKVNREERKHAALYPKVAWTSSLPTAHPVLRGKHYSVVPWCFWTAAHEHLILLHLSPIIINYGYITVK